MAARTSHLAAKWRLLRFDPGSGSLAPPLEGTELTAQFSDDGRLGGSAGCNRYMTTYETTDASLSVQRQIASTQMWCEHPKGTMDQESAFLRGWGRVTAYDLQGDRLELLDPDGAIVFVFARAELSEGTLE